MMVLIVDLKSFMIVNKYEEKLFITGEVVFGVFGLFGCGIILGVGIEIYGFEGCILFFSRFFLGKVNFEC